MNTYFTILVGSLLVNNFVMNKFLGICPFLGVSKKFETSMGMGMAVTFVMTMATNNDWSLCFNFGEGLGDFVIKDVTICEVK